MCILAMHSRSGYVPVRSLGSELELEDLYVLLLLDLKSMQTKEILT